MKFKKWLYAFFTLFRVPFFLVFFLLFIKPVFAGGIVSPVCSAGTSNCSDMIVQDGVGAFNGTSTLYATDSAHFGFSIPQGAKITAVSYSIRAYHTGGALTGGGMLTPTAGEFGFSNCGSWGSSGNILPNSGSYGTYNLPITNIASTCVQSNAVWAGYIGSQLGLSWGAGGYNNIDFLSVSITYLSGGSFYTLDSAVASSSAGLVVLSAHGSFDITPAHNLACKQQIYARCYVPGVAGGTKNTPDVNIEYFSDEVLLTTLNEGSGLYEGVADLVNSNAWSFSGVTAPFVNGGTCDYPMSYYCGHYDTGGSFIVDVAKQGINSNQSNFAPELIA